MRCLSLKIEGCLRSSDGKTTERYKNKQRERIYAETKRWCAAAGIPSEVVMDGLFMFHRVRACAARLHSPLTVALICVIVTEEQLRKEDEGREPFVYPPSKKIRMNYGKTSRQKWIEFLEEQTYGKIPCENSPCTPKDSDSDTSDHLDYRQSTR